MLFSLLEVSESTTNIVATVSMIAIAIAIVAVVLLCSFTQKFSTNELAFGGVCLATSFALSFIKVSPVTYGGSITLASFVPLLIYAYRYGAIKGLLCGIVLGLLNFISEPYILTPMTFVLDYILAFGSIGAMGLMRKLPKLSSSQKVVIGTILVYVLRFIFHLLSGFIYFAENAIWVDLPATNMFVYSFLYQLVYLPADCIIASIAMYMLSRSSTLDRLYKMMEKK